MSSLTSLPSPGVVTGASFPPRPTSSQQVVVASTSYVTPMHRDADPSRPPTAAETRPPTIGQHPPYLQQVPLSSQPMIDAIDQCVRTRLDGFTALFTQFTNFLVEFNNASVTGIDSRFVEFDGAFGERLHKLENAEYRREQRMATRIDALGSTVKDAMQNAVVVGVEAALVEHRRERDALVTAVSDAMLLGLSSRFDDVLRQFEKQDTNTHQLQISIDALQTRSKSLEEQVSAIVSTSVSAHSSTANLNEAFMHFESQVAKRLAESGILHQQLAKVVNAARDEAHAEKDNLASMLEGTTNLQTRCLHTVMKELQVLKDAVGVRCLKIPKDGDKPSRMASLSERLAELEVDVQEVINHLRDAEAVRDVPPSAVYSNGVGLGSADNTMSKIQRTEVVDAGVMTADALLDDDIEGDATPVCKSLSMQETISNSKSLELVIPKLDTRQSVSELSEEALSGKTSATTLVNSSGIRHDSSTPRLSSLKLDRSRTISPCSDSRPCPDDSNESKNAVSVSTTQASSPSLSSQDARTMLPTTSRPSGSLFDLQHPPSPLTSLGSWEDADDGGDVDVDADVDDDWTDKELESEEEHLPSLVSDLWPESSHTHPLATLSNHSSVHVPAVAPKGKLAVFFKYVCPNGCGRKYVHSGSLQRHLNKIGCPRNLKKNHQSSGNSARSKAESLSVTVSMSSTKGRSKLPKHLHLGPGLGKASHTFKSQRPRKRRKLSHGFVDSVHANSSGLNLGTKKEQGLPRSESKNAVLGPSHSSDILAACEWPKKTSVGEVFDRQFIQCDKCDSYYHFRCVGIVDGDIRLNEDEPFICPPCVLLSESAKQATNIANPVCCRPDCDWPGAACNYTEDFFVVERILGRTLSDEPDPENPGSIYLWLIEWQGYSMADCEWVLSEYMGDSQRLIRQFYLDVEREKADRGWETILLKRAYRRLEEGVRKHWKWVIQGGVEDS